MDLTWVCGMGLGSCLIIMRSNELCPQEASSIRQAGMCSKAVMLGYSHFWNKGYLT